MSGGSLDYFYTYLESHVGDFGDKELDELVKDLAQLFHDREWYLSSDTCEGAWEEARKAFKEKWFTAHGRRKRIEKYLDSIRDEVFKSFGMSDKYCVNCSKWTQDKREGYSEYGSCSNEHSCLMHKYESCDNFSKR